MKRLIILSLCCLLALPALAKDHKSKKRLILGLLVASAASLAFDAYTTQQTQSNGGFEMNPILGRHPGSKKIALYFGSCLALETTADYFLEKKHHDKLAIGIPAAIAASETGYVIHNYHILDKLKGDKKLQ